jgi:hypothetical protein
MRMKQICKKIFLSFFLNCKYIVFFISAMLLCFKVQAADADQGDDYKQPIEDLTSIALKEESEHKCYRSPEGLIYRPYNEVTSRVKHVQMHNTITPEVLCSNNRERKRLRNKINKKGHIFFCDPNDRTKPNKVHPDVIRLADQVYYALKEASLVELEQGTETTNGNVTINNINYEVSVTSSQKDLYKYSLRPSNLDEENTEFITGHYVSPDAQVTRVYGYTIHIYRREYINTFSPFQYTD